MKFNMRVKNIKNIQSKYQIFKIYRKCFKKNSPNKLKSKRKKKEEDGNKSEW